MHQLEAKLERFIRKYYKDELLRGLLFFIAIGLAYVLLVLGIEYFFWLNTWGRGILFWSFVGIEALLLIRFIGIPILRLFKLSKGIDYSEASKLIGNHWLQQKYAHFFKNATFFSKNVSNNLKYDIESDSLCEPS